ncbi:hypothetical protein WISP_128249 [Willisornis vidua]|uniref:Uncharacterized protein n=1 Tax=Willisornis vidua TaxID=1566151 RepID=A0ABQ9CQ57_9PASS|nr:hypothetical protein WISP_128249 [Willisornis vidua]
MAGRALGQVLALRLTPRDNFQMELQKKDETLQTSGWRDCLGLLTGVRAVEGGLVACKRHAVVEKLSPGEDVTRVCSNTRKKAFTDDCTLNQAALRGHRVSILTGVQKPTAHSPEQLAFTDPALKSGVGPGDCTGPCEPPRCCESVLLLTEKSFFLIQILPGRLSLTES